MGDNRVATTAELLAVPTSAGLATVPADTLERLDPDGLHVVVAVRELPLPGPAMIGCTLHCRTTTGNESVPAILSAAQIEQLPDVFSVLNGFTELLPEVVHDALSRAVIPLASPWAAPFASTDQPALRHGQTLGIPLDDEF